MHIDPRNLEKSVATPGERRFLLVFVLILLALFGAEVFHDFTPVKSSIFFFILAWGPLTILHELGHAVVARLFGWEVHEIAVGFGRVVKRWQWGKAQVELRTFPLGGHVVPVPTGRRGARVASFFIYAAGPGIELLVVGLAALLLGFDVLTSRSQEVGIIAVQAACAAAMVGAVTNLLPLTTPEGAWTDGKGMLMSPFLAPSHFDRMMASPQLVEGNRLLDQGDAAGALAAFEAGLARFPDVVLLHYGRARALSALGRRLEALLNLQSAANDSTRTEEFRQQAAILLQHLRDSK